MKAVTWKKWLVNCSFRLSKEKRRGRTNGMVIFFSLDNFEFFIWMLSRLPIENCCELSNLYIIRLIRATQKKAQTIVTSSRSEFLWKSKLDHQSWIYRTKTSSRSSDYYGVRGRSKLFSQPRARYRPRTQQLIIILWCPEYVGIGFSPSLILPAKCHILDSKFLHFSTQHYVLLSQECGMSLLLSHFLCVIKNLHLWILRAPRVTSRTFSRSTSVGDAYPRRFVYMMEGDECVYRG